MDGQVIFDIIVMDIVEIKMQDELVVKKGVVDEEFSDMLVQEIDGKVVVSEIDVDLNVVIVDLSNEDSLVQDIEKIDRDVVFVIDCVYSDSKGIDVDVVERQEFKKENFVIDN